MGHKFHDFFLGRKFNLLLHLLAFGSHHRFHNFCPPTKSSCCEKLKMESSAAACFYHYLVWYHRSKKVVPFCSYWPKNLYFLSLSYSSIHFQSFSFESIERTVFQKIIKEKKCKYIKNHFMMEQWFLSN